MRHPLTLLSILPCFAIFIMSCDKKNDEVTNVDVTATAVEAYTEMENQMYALSTATINNSSDLDRISFQHANELYKEILTADPTHPGANFGAALTEVFGAFADPVVNDVIKRWEAAQGRATRETHLFRFGIPTTLGDLGIPKKALAENLGNMLLKGLADPPTLAEMQTVFRDRFAPRLDYALARLAVVEQDPSFEMPISGKMQGDPALSTVYLDLTEVYIIDAMLRGTKAGVDGFLVYRFELPDYTTRSVVEALQPSNQAFFGLATDGAARAAGIHANIVTLIGRLRSAISYLRSETDDQSDDIIKAPSSGPGSPNWDELDSALVTATDWLTNPQTVDIRNADTDGNDYTVQVNLSSFYLNPPQNIKTAWLPAYTVDTSAQGDIMWHWTQQDYGSFTFPDPTFAGTFPGMTNETLKRILHIDEAFAFHLSVNLNDESYALGSGTTVTVTVNSQTYLPKERWSYEWTGYKHEEFLILDNDGQNAGVSVVYNGTPVTVSLNADLVVRLKSYEYVSIDVTPAPQTIMGTGYGPTNRYVSLSIGQYGHYFIERRSTGEFSVIDSTTGSSNYYDYSVPASGTYQYRVHRKIPYYYTYGVYGIRTSNYSNTATVTVP